MPRLTDADIAARRRGIGSSDVPAIVGVSPYADHTPMSVYAAKVGIAVEREHSDAMEWGHMIEPVLVQWLTLQTGLQTETAPAAMVGPEPWMLASADARVVGVDAHVECKSVGVGVTSRGWDTASDDGYPDHVRVQMAWQCEVLRTSRCYLVALVLGRPRIYIYDHDAELGRMLVDACRAFWGRVQRGEPPPLDGSPSTRAYLAAKYPPSERRAVHATPDAEDLARERMELMSTVAGAESRIAEIDARLMEMIGTADSIEGDGWHAIWRPRKDGVRVFRFTRRT